MKDPNLPLYRSRSRRQIDWRNWIIFIAAIVLLVAAMTLIWGNAEAAATDPCRAERADWRDKRVTAVRIGREWPQSYWTAWANLHQCEAEHRER